MDKDIEKLYNENHPHQDQVSGSDQSKINMDMNYTQVPNNPYTTSTNAQSLGMSEPFHGLTEKPSFFQTFKSEAFDWNSTFQGIHASYDELEKIDPRTDVAPNGWNPKSDSENFVNVRPEYLNYLSQATGPKDQKQRLEQVYSQQRHDDTLANGSFMAKALGGIAGVATDATSYIPIVGWAKYGKLAPSFYKNVMRATPGAAGYAVASSALEQSDKINGNVHDFLLDSFIKTSFGVATFGVGGAVSHMTEKMALWNLRDIAKGSVEGIDFRLATDAEGKITGYKAIDTTGSLSSAKVNNYQQLADSTFAKAGVFKIPFVGAGISKALALKFPYTNIYFGSQLQSMLTSPYKTVRGFIDRAADHSILTEGILKGETAPKRFGSLMNQTAASFRALSVQINALHLERNGYNIKNRIAGGVVDKGLYLKNKGLELLSKDLDKIDYVSKEEFYSEVEEALTSGKGNEHNAVNEAAHMLREHMDDTWKRFLGAYNKGQYFMSPKTAMGYLTRVYDTPYLNTNKPQWVNVISDYLREADQTISEKMEPIESFQKEIKAFEAKHTEAVDLLSRYRREGVPAKKSKQPERLEQGVTHTQGEPEELPQIEPGSKAHTLRSMRMRLKSMKEALQNELRDNPDLQLHVHDWSALSANESKELVGLLKPMKKLDKEIEKQRAVVKSTQNLKRSRQYKAKQESSMNKAIPKAEEHAAAKKQLESEKQKLNDLKRKRETEYERLQEKAHNGEINDRFYRKDPEASIYHFKDPKERLKFRDRYAEGSEENPNVHRKTAAAAYYDTIMQQTPEETINQIMGRVMGSDLSNPTKSRSILVPDKLLYDNNFMTKDLMSKVANYTFHLDRRTHIKNVYGKVTLENGISELFGDLAKEHAERRGIHDDRKAELQEKLNNPDLSEAEKRAIKKDIHKVDKNLVTTQKEFDQAKREMSHIYDKMIGYRRYSRGAETGRSVVMALTAMASLPFVPFTMLNDLGAAGLKHGMTGFFRDGIYPLITSLNGMLKTQGSESFRKTVGSVHLGLQDVLNGYADKNWGMYTNPYLNKGRIVSGIEKLAHFSSNFTLTNYIDNGLQRFTGSVVQSELMRILHSFNLGKMSEKDSIYLRKYGIDPKKWGDRMVDAWKKNGGGKNKLGGYHSLFWKWDDKEAANEFSSAVFNGIKDTQIQAGIADSPFWTDSPLGAIIKGFNGWMYASVNRYLIPTLQQPDAERLIGMSFMLGLGALIDPTRRLARGEEAFPKNQTDSQFLYSAFNNSGIFSFLSNTLSDANVLSGDRLLEDLKSDKYKDRSRAGLLGPTWGQFNRLADIFDAAASGEWNKADMKKAARMIPIANASWTYWMTKKYIDGLNIPETRRQAKAGKG